MKEALNNLLQCLEWEREAEIEFFREKFRSTSIDERKEEGVTWYPVRISDESIGLGERIVLTIERNEQDAHYHHFQGGSVVSLFSNANPDAKLPPSTTGVVVDVKKHQLKLALHDDEMPDWAYDGKLGLDLFYDERSYREMEKALRRVLHAENNRLAELREIFFGKKQADFREGPEVFAVPELNDSQNRALALVARARDVALIHGPPGTGKTTTLVQAVHQTLKHEKQVLVCAASNLAVDLLTERLGMQGVRVLRLGHPARITEEILHHSLDAQIQVHPSFKDLKTLRKDAEEVRRQALKFKRKFGHNERKERRELLTQANLISRQARSVEDYILESLIENAEVITCTLVGTATEILRDREFSSLFIDEAAQALEPSCWIAIEKANRIIFAGDHKQLPPTVKSNRAEAAGFGKTLFERLMDFGGLDVMLRTQYRMHEDIMGFSNDWFYDGALIAEDSVAHATLIQKNHEPLEGPVIEFVDTAGAGFMEEQDPKTLSRSNPQEGEALLNHLAELLPKLRKTRQDGTEEPFSIGIISPYRQQVKWFEAEVPDRKDLWKWQSAISIGTVDGFQGQEREIIYISMVRSNDDREIGFLQDIRRMNVALTRAKRKLVVFGDSATIGNHPFYRKFLEYVEEKGGYKSVWEFLQW